MNRERQLLLFMSKRFREEFNNSEWYSELDKKILVEIAEIVERECNEEDDDEAEICHLIRPVAWQVRSRPDWAMEWGEWQPCTESSYEDYKKYPVLHDWWYDVRELFAAPPHCMHKKNITGE